MDFVANKTGENEYSVVCWESELKAICGMAAEEEMEGLETGGELYGLYTQSDKPVIMFATPAGPSARHGPGYFIQDLEFFKYANKFLFQEFQINFIGSHHVHPHFSFSPNPSSIDVQGAKSIGFKNSMEKVYLFTITFERCSRSFNKKIVRVNSYVYEIKNSFKPIPCKILVLPGISPIRRAISDYPEAKKLIRPDCYLPISQIRWDGCYQINSKLPIQKPQPFNKSLIRQFKRLPAEIQSKIQVQCDHEIMVISIPMPPKGTLYLGCVTQNGYRTIRSVYFSSTESLNGPIDITKRATKWGPFTRIQTIYSTAKSFIRHLV